MNIAVNTRLLRKNRLDGIGWFTYETLSRITRKHQEHQFHFIFDHAPDTDYMFAPNIVPHVLFPPARHPFLYPLWFEISIPFLLKKIQADLFLSPDGYLSLRSHIPTVAVIHDLNFEHNPEHLPALVRKYYTFFFPKFAEKAHRIATVSQFSAADIAERYHIPVEKIDVVYNGASEVFRPLDPSAISAVRKKYTSGFPYFIMVGSLHPRKNIANQLLAFDRFRSSGSCPCKFVIAGEKMWWTADLRTAFENMKHRNDVIFTGRLSQHELHQLLGASLALSYVSFFEGFGIPILEAFSSGTAVITSNTTSMPEVAGNAALYADPHSINDIADAYKTIFENHELRHKLIEMGKDRCQLFSWDKTAEKLWDSILKTGLISHRQEM